jgi:hypothetical protein
LDKKKNFFFFYCLDNNVKIEPGVSDDLILIILGIVVTSHHEIAPYKEEYGT